VLLGWPGALFQQSGYATEAPVMSLDWILQVPAMVGLSVWPTTLFLEFKFQPS